jgi:hypothetical protein
MTETIRKKLIEVSIPLKAINAASACEKLIRRGHPFTLQFWSASCHRKLGVSIKQLPLFIYDTLHNVFPSEHDSANKLGYRLLWV